MSYVLRVRYQSGVVDQIDLPAGVTPASIRSDVENLPFDATVYIVTDADGDLWIINKRAVEVYVVKDDDTSHTGRVR